MSETREKRFDPTSPSSTTRREFLQDALAIAGVAAASSLVGTAAVGAAEQSSGTKRPNLVFFLGEGHRADALSLAKHPFLKTPNQERIGAAGGRFENAFCTNALCAPARATL